jgi:hypothetical protein
VSSTQVPLSGTEAAVIGLVAFAAVSCGWRPPWPRSPLAGNAGHADPTQRPGLAVAGVVEPGSFGIMICLRCRRVAPGGSAAIGAEYNKAPFMYEMKGALSGRAAPDPPVARLPRTARRPPVPSAQANHRFPGCSPVPELPPDGARFQR